jgi:hypothetical protein
MSYANVMSTLAVFLLLAGGGAYAAGKLKRNSVKSKHIAPDAVTGDDANEGTFGKVPSAGTADSANTAALADSASTAALANSVAANSIGPGEVQNPVRSVNLPLTTFFNRIDQAELDFAASDGTSPDFNVANSQLVIEWDADTDAGAGNIADVDSVASTFLVPPDYASGGLFAVRVSKDGHSGQTERLRCGVYLNTGGGGADVGVTLTTAASTVYALLPPGSYAVGTSVQVYCFADDGTGFAPGTSANNVVRLEGMEFRYSATQ